MIVGVTHPIPQKFAKRIYENGKTVFVGKKFLGRVSEGNKFIIYESRGAGAYTGWADIKKMGIMKPDEIWNSYGEKLMISKEELEIYSYSKQKMSYIEFENFEKFKNPVKPKRFVSVGGKYVHDNEYKKIEREKD